MSCGSRRGFPVQSSEVPWATAAMVVVARPACEHSLERLAQRPERWCFTRARIF